LKARWLLGTLAIVALWAILYSRRTPDGVIEEPVPKGFVGGALCKECHEKEYAAWTGSHHERAMLEPTAESVLGDFKDARFSQYGVETRFTQRDGKYFITTEGADGKPHEFPVRYTFGWYPLQQYLLDVGNGRMQAATIAWDTDAGRWFSIYEERIPSGDQVHWSGPMFTANHMCVECHTTAFRKGYDAASDSYDSTWREINVSCEACHGPGYEHVVWANDENSDASDSRMAVTLKGPEQISNCARCHSRRSRLSSDDDLTRPFLDYYDPALLTEPLYHADGQILDEVYVWGSFQQSKMHGAGVVCTDCHDPHNARLLREGNALCTECHCTEPPEERFPTLKKRAYETFEHHGHEPGKEGSLCIECHMRTKTYMGNDVRHDHSLRIPRPDLTATIGTPNACADCHLDRPPEWAAQAMLAMGDGKAMEKPHYGTVFAAARQNQPAAVEGLVRILHGEAEPAIVRATAAHELGRFATQESLSALTDALHDPDAIVRAAAGSAIGGLPWSGGEVEYGLKKLLADPMRLVRVSAAPSWRGEPAASMDEVEERNEALADRAEGPYNTALSRERAKDSVGAEREYRKAIARDPNFLPARFNLGNLLSRLGRTGEAEDQFRAVLGADPENGEAYYSLGLLAAEQGRLPDAAAALQKAAELLPGRARVRYNLGLALAQIGRPAAAGAALESAHTLAPRDPQILYALVSHHAQLKEWEKATLYAGLLVALSPEDPRAAQILEAVMREASSAGKK